MPSSCLNCVNACLASMACCILNIFKCCVNKNRLCKNTNGSFCMQACAPSFRLSGIILVFSVNPSVQQHMQTTHSLPGWFISQQIPSERPGPHQMFGKGCCFETTVNFSLNRPQTGLDFTLHLLSFSRLICYYHPSSSPHRFCFTLAGY